MCIALCTTVAHNTAQNRPDNFPSYPPDNHHCSDDVYLSEGGKYIHINIILAPSNPVDYCESAIMCSEAVENATGPLLVEIDKPFCCSLGVELASSSVRGRNVIGIRNIVPASIADRSVHFRFNMLVLWHWVIAQLVF